MKVTNPKTDRALIAQIEGVWYEIPAGESVDFEDYVVASTMVEHGGKAVPAELQAARELWAEANRQENSRTASAAASEGQILGRQQTTVTVATGAVTGDATEPLTGKALDEAVRAANDAGANIGSRLKADEKRDALIAWQRLRGSSTPVSESRPNEFVVDEAGELVLDGEGQPIPAASASEVDAANAPHEVTDPAAVVVANPEEVDGIDFDAAMAAGVEVPEGDADSRLAWVAEGADQDERRVRASAVYVHERDTESASEGELVTLGGKLTAAVYGTPE